MLERIVIVGAGQAAVQAVDTLRRQGYKGSIIVVGEEPWLPYQRPPLSKKYLAGALDRERLPLRAAEYYGSHGIEMRLGSRIEEISRRQQRLRVDDGSTLAYDALLLATGSRARPLAAPGAELEGVFFLRTIADVERIRASMTAARRLVIVGGGYIGLEVAATAREAGLDVTVLEMAERVMSRVVCPEVSRFFEAEHARHGVRVLCGCRVKELLARPGSGRVRTVLTEDAAEHSADMVVVGCGAVPCDELARAAGVACEDGILVDERCRTSDPLIYAAGDCTCHPSPHYGRRLRLESVDNAFEQGASAALNMLGIDTVHHKVPWFWSDQYDLKLIIVGVSQDHDSVVLRGNRPSRSFSACYLRGGELVAVDSINSPKDQMAARKLIAARARPALEKLADCSVPLKDAA